MRHRIAQTAVIGTVLLVLAAWFGLRRAPGGDGPPPSWTAEPTSDWPTGPARLGVVTGGGSAPFVAEVLLSVGLKDLSVGPAGSDVAVIASPEGCAAEAPLRLVLLPCPVALAELDLPAPQPRDSLSTDEGLPLPPAQAWSRDGLPTGVEPVLSAGDAAFAVRAPGLLLFSFDLSEHLRTLRQGEVRFADVDRDGVHGPKPNDLAPFRGEAQHWARAGGDRWARWLQAQLGDWPAEPTLPDGAPTVLVLTFDQDFAEADWIDALLARVEERGGTATVLRTDTTRQKRGDGPEAAGPALPPEKLAIWRRKGHGLGLHPHVVGTEQQRWPGVITRQAQRQAGEPGPPPRAIRHHFLRWWGYGAPLALHAELGLWIDLDFVSIEPRFDRPGFGFGGALPMRFQGEQGALLPVLVQPTVLEDDVLIGDYGYSHGLTVEGAVAALPAVFEESAAVGAPVVANLHPTNEVGRRAALLDALLDEAERRGAPVWSAERWAAFTWGRLNRQLARSGLP